MHVAKPCGDSATLLDTAPEVEAAMLCHHCVVESLFVLSHQRPCRDVLLCLQLATSVLSMTLKDSYLYFPLINF